MNVKSLLTKVMAVALCVMVLATPSFAAGAERLDFERNSASHTEQLSNSFHAFHGLTSEDQIALAPLSDEDLASVEGQYYHWVGVVSGTITICKFAYDVGLQIGRASLNWF
jgi:hypothetical protein